MASFTYTVTIPRPEEEVFPWLLEADRVPQWTSHLEHYEPEGAVGPGATIRQRLEVSGQTFDVAMEVVRYLPPREAQTRFTTNGIDVEAAYRLAPDGGGTRLTQSLEAKARSLSARLIVPVVQPRLERKLIGDLERLQALLSGRA
jgi:carbon monoxide dehydrogenase subunit G